MIESTNLTRIQIPLQWDHECFNGIFKFFYQIFGYESFVFAEVKSVNLTGHVYSDFLGYSFYIPITEIIKNVSLGKEILFIILCYICFFVIFYHHIITTQNSLIQVVGNHLIS